MEIFCSYRRLIATRRNEKKRKEIFVYIYFAPYKNGFFFGKFKQKP